MFQSLEDYYAFLEEETATPYDHEVLRGLKVLYESIEDDQLRKYCLYESLFNEFLIIEGKLTPTATSNTGEGYPSLSFFTDDLAYVKTRAENVQNPKYKAKYNHLLWESKHKNHKYAKSAIESYLLFLENTKNALANSKDIYRWVADFKNLYVLSSTVNYKKEEIHDLLLSFIDSPVSSYQKCNLMSFINEKVQKSEKPLLQKFQQYADSILQTRVNPNLVEPYLELLIKLSSKLNISAAAYHEKLAEYYVASVNKDSGSLIAYRAYHNAIMQYRKANNKTKIEEISVLLEKTKKEISLKRVESTHESADLQKLWDIIETEINNLIEIGNSHDIYRYIIQCPNIIPNADLYGERIRPATFDYVSELSFDINKNMDHTKETGFSVCSLFINNFTIRHLWLILSKGIAAEKISFESFMDFLEKETWYGQNHSSLTESDEASGFDWLELLAPSLCSFFTQLSIEIEHNNKMNHGYILAIDSLVIKFEGLFREISRLVGAQTIEVKENKTEERISYEKLLDNEKLKALIPANDLAFFKFLFTSDGLNLRNNIAHCFYPTNKYSLSIMLLLIAALLKLGNYKMTVQE